MKQTVRILRTATATVNEQLIVTAIRGLYVGLYAQNDWKVEFSQAIAQKLSQIGYISVQEKKMPHHSNAFLYTLAHESKHSTAAMTDLYKIGLYISELKITANDKEYILVAF